MRHTGATYEYEAERNGELLRTFRSLLAAENTIRLKQVLAKLVSMPSSRFWVSSERATIVITEMLKGGSIEAMSPNKKAMFTEIYQRVKRLIKRYPGRPLNNIVAEVVEQPAPCFYLTPQSARVILHKAKKQCRSRLIP
jgi:hypothetical protein